MLALATDYVTCLFQTGYTVCMLWLGVLLLVVSNEQFTSYDALTKCKSRVTSYASSWTPKANAAQPLRLTAPVTSQTAERAQSSFLVPNIVHYVWFNKLTRAFQFHHMLSILSVDKYIKPDVIYFHTNKVPTGTYWNQVLEVQNFQVLLREPDNKVFGVRLKNRQGYETTLSNVERVKIVYEFGGIYMDLDYIALKSFDTLRKYACTLGYERDGLVCGGVIVCARESPFLALWLRAFVHDYRPRQWAYNSGHVPSRLARQHPHLVHIEATSLHRPSWNRTKRELGQLLLRSSRWNRTRNYGVHLWYRQWRYFLPGRRDTSMTSPNQDFNSIRTLDNPYGEIARAILFGSADIVAK